MIIFSTDASARLASHCDPKAGTRQIVYRSDLDRRPARIDLVLAVGVSLVGFLACSAPAFAHAHLKSAVPAANSAVATSPTELDLAFSEGVNLKFTGVKVTGPGKAAVATGEAALGAKGDTVLVVPIPTPLAAGTYTVEWHALATDGHKTSGTYSFTIEP